jgi:hypothetical protein
MSAAIYQLTEYRARKLLPEHSPQHALMRAKRVIGGGGCISVAIYQAVGDR